MFMATGFENIKSKQKKKFKKNEAILGNKYSTKLVVLNMWVSLQFGHVLILPPLLHDSISSWLCVMCRGCCR